ncbi:heterokaryon incompatibility protein-domain-containing protein [Phaeosphaeria sp. MPI-PUGE-AT-0046c]|nr:heterokaryon incompatibility protein-domain-containing protein [Phaeosphaeria sp. MPI-PUGE-AT-0046c]
MASSTDSRPSLIVKLPFNPLCSKCTDAVSRWCSPTSHGGFDMSYDRCESYRTLTDTDDYGGTRTSWTWHIGTLQVSSLTCPCCRFLLDTVNAMPGDPYYENDFLHMSTQLLGSRHIALPQRAFGPTWSVHSLLGNGKTLTTEHKSYYRPSVRIYRPLRLYEPGEMPEQNHYYAPEHINFILPVDKRAAASEESESTEAFLGRLIDPTVNLALVRSWIHKCATTHGVSTTQGIGYFRPAEDNHGCTPKMSSYIAGFRLIDIAQRCVVRVNHSAKYEYAALSYVWGNARRLLLGRDNETLLSVPGALSSDNTSVPKTFIDALYLAEILAITHIWIDALCILQDDPEQLMKHMSHMEEVYSSAILTIVSDTPSADTGIPGISTPRWPPQASFTWAGTTYLSTRKTFGEALNESPWEKRAWCLQEKIFSKRLLILTEAQAFYHCGAATWFEDTVLEEKANISGPVHMRQKAMVGRKGSDKKSIYSIAYEAHREYFMRNFWSLVQIYSKRDISFETDTLRAFAGILKSVEAEFGPAIWGTPSFEFARGLTWLQSSHHLELRNHNFPSWSWAGWRSGGEVNLRFRPCKRSDDDLRVFGGRYHISKHKHAGRSAWDVDWHYYSDESTLSAVPSKQNSKTKDQNMLGALTNSVKSLSIASRNGASAPTEDLAVPCKQCMSNPTPLRPAHTDNTIPDLFHYAKSMPPISYIIRFYSSVATVFISPEAKSNESYPNRDDDLLPQGAEQRYYVHEVLIPETSELIGFVELDPEWSGIGHLHDLVYITRWCPNFAGFDDDQRQHPEKLNCLLIENVSGWGEVKQRVQLVQPLSLALWWRAKPRWELVSLA